MTAVPDIAKLTPRQREILVLLARGNTLKVTARALYIEPSTVATHIKRIFRALNVNTTVQAAVLAAKAGLV